MINKNYQTYNYLVTGHHLHEWTWKLKVWLGLFRVFADSLNNVCLARIKEVGETGSTVRTLQHVDCLLINTPKQNKCVVNQLKYVDDISFRGLFGSIRVAFSKKKKRKRKAVSLPTTKYLYLLWTNSFYLYFRFEYGIIEKRTQVIYEISYGITKHLSK